MFDATPLDWSWGSAGSRGFGLSPLGCTAFSAIPAALSQIEKRICNVELINSVPPAIFDTQGVATKRPFLHGDDVFTRLKKLRLDIAMCDRGLGKPYDKLRGLRILLDRNRDLEVLELCLEREKIGGPGEEEDL